MTGFLIATVRVKDEEKFGEYAAKAGPLVAQFGGQVTLRGGLAKTLAGDASPHKVAIMQFPDLDAIDNWFASDGYQAIIPLRDQACDMDLFAYAGPPA